MKSYITYVSQTFESTNYIDTIVPYEIIQASSKSKTNDAGKTTDEASEYRFH